MADHKTQNMYDNFYAQPYGRALISASAQVIESFAYAEISGPRRKILLLGYGAPYKEIYQAALKDLDQSHIFCCDTTQSGALQNISKALASPLQLPFADHSFDHIFVVHALENSTDAAACLREIYRILKPRGSVLLFVTNRASAWAHQEETPLGQGQPYSMRQLRKAVQSAEFAVERAEGMFYLPPVCVKGRQDVRDIWVKTAELWESAGAYIPLPAGRNVMRLGKHISGITPIGSVDAAGVAVSCPQA